ncbi:large conductance mechanosensitive channel protein MscL [Alloscardovia omnicolens]|uniref:Large-conductance mechanosensitive channel n=1 Tax=Alloscardovia omnicolens F0580 TaxID=1321816 RepID=U1QPV0_9BIFI|nr:large conductance mechanosensitive channel protein MscL [Alloscardovia omnicolens]ERH29545.1 large conductance mechanosensitive channel protein [Alloscardovia omnicolens F0580]KWZ74162.1 large conductance mechanosensitive channel protein [Alloscardovia omnicolens]MBS6346771.1 large conductance mechanosensitive channel protein MscL [Alloscardovia omnicolens]MDK6249625.1 large conductance mechanosensitive channel protein MscL [Alloscardovia omnicolens]MDK6327919.1 large conductance mechanosen
MIKGFKDFISRGNVVDMAVGVVMGGAVTAVVTSIVENFINPLVAMIFGKPDMSDLLKFTFNGATISFGAILTALINFLIIAVAVYFFIVLPMSKLKDMTAKQEAAEEAAAEPSAEEVQLATLQEIRDLLKAQKN